MKNVSFWWKLATNVAQSKSNIYCYKNLIFFTFLDWQCTFTFIFFILFEEQYDDEIQMADTTVHIKRNRQMTFTLQYKEQLQDMVEAGVKILDRARIAFDIYGTTVDDLVGELYSPNYPEPYPNSADITWWVRAPMGKTVRLQVVDLDIEECCDRLTVYDGHSIHGNAIAVLTGTTSDLATTVLQSTTNSLFLHLTSDCSEARSGFKATVSTTGDGLTTTSSPATTHPSYQACNGGDYIYAWSGNIQSPNYPSAYDSNMNCSWSIQIPSSYYRVNLTALDFQLEANYDYLYIYDGDSYLSPTLAAWTGHKTGSTVISSSNTLFLYFISDYVNEWQGFNLSFSYYYPSHEPTTGPPLYECGGTDYVYVQPGNDSKYFSLPTYQNNMDCSWIISSPARVKLTDIHIHLAYDNDRVTFYDGSSSSYPLLGSFYGDYHPSDIYSSGHYIYVEFVTDSWGTGTGFWFYASAEYNETQLTASTPNYFNSPNYPNHYDNNVFITWKIQAFYSSYSVTAAVTDLSLESCCDVLRFYDGSSLSAPEISWQGTYDYIFSSGRYMYVQFSTDGSVTARGFQVLYYQVSYIPQETTSPSWNDQTTTASVVNSTCMSPEYVTAYNSHRSLYSPNYPNYYYNNAHCSWQISTYYGNSYFVQAAIVDYDLENCCDYLRFYDGPSSSYPQIYPQFGNTTYNSMSGYMYIQFTSDSSVTGRGFQVDYIQIYQYQPPTTVAYPDETTGSYVCGSTEYLTANWNYHYISSPNYPNNYYNNAYCTWRISAYYSYYYVQVRVTDFDLEPGDDYLKFYDGSSSSYPEIDWQGVNSPIYSSGNYMYIKFTSDGSVTRSGFQLQFVQTSYVPVEVTTIKWNDETTFAATSGSVAACNGGEHIHIYSGSYYIYSPNYPSNYNNYMYCTWTIHNPSYGYIIELYVYDLYLADYDKVYLYDGSSESAPMLASFYSYYYQYYTAGTTSYMFIKFDSDGSYTSRGFQFMYSTTYLSQTSVTYGVQDEPEEK